VRHGGFAQWVPRIVLGLLVGGVSAVGSIAHTLADAPPGALEIELASSTGGTLQVFYDRGAGFSEAESVTAALAPSDEAVTYRLALPFGRYRLLRIDPNTRAGRYVFGELRIVDARGETVAVLSPDAIRATVQARVERVGAGGFAVTTPPDANDPQLVFAPDRPLLLLPAQANLARVAGLSLAAMLAVLLLATMADRVTAGSTLLGRAVALAGRWPWHAVVCAGVLGALASTYPLLLGRSLVSPGNGPAWILYDQPPFTYGAHDPRVDSARGTDVGAMMWAILPYTVVQRVALAEGELPLWNRYNSTGAPLWGQGQTFILDPFHAASLAIPDPALAMDVRFVVARAVFAAGAGAATLVVTGSWAAGTLVALTAPFIGHFTMRFNHPAYFSVVYAPWILLAYAGLAMNTSAAQRWRWSAWLAVATFLQLVGTTPKEGMMALVGAHAAGMTGLLLVREPLAQKLGRVDAALLGGITALLLSAPHWLIFLDTLARSSTQYDQPAVQFADWADLVSYVLGGATPGTPQTGAHPLLVMAGVSALVFPRRVVSSRVGLGALVAIAVLAGLAFGLLAAEVLVRLPLVGNIYHVDNSFLAATIAPLLVLAGVGLAALADEVRAGAVGRPTLVVAAGTVAMATLVPGVGVDLASLLALLTIVGAAAAVCVLLTAPGATPSAAIAMAVSLLAAVFAGGLQWETGVAAADEVLIQPRPRTNLLDPSPSVRAMHARAGREPFRVASVESVMFPGTQAYWQLEGIGGPDALRLPAIEDVSDAAGVERTIWMWRTVLRPSTIDTAGAFLDMLNVRFLAARVDQMPPGVSALPTSSPDLIRVIERPSAWPRAFFTTGVGRHRDVQDLMASLNGARGPFASVDARDTDAVNTITHLPTGGEARPATDYALTSNSTSFRVEARSAGLAVLSEAFIDADFTATLNGRSVPYIRVNHAFKAVAIPAAGNWTVRFEYRPRLWGWAWTLAGAGLTLLIALWVLAGRLLN
jgi:hypothetical protein